MYLYMEYSLDICYFYIVFTFLHQKVIPEKYLDENTVYHLQPSGAFVIGGPQVINYNGMLYICSMYLTFLKSSPNCE